VTFHVLCELCGGVYDETLTKHLSERHANVMLDITVDDNEHATVKLIER